MMAKTPADTNHGRFGPVLDRSPRGAFPCRRVGQGLVEFALCSMLFFIVLCGIIESSWVFYNQAYLENTVILACRKGVTQLTYSQIQTVVATAVSGAVGGLRINAPTILITDTSGRPTTTRTTGFTLTVGARLQYQALTPIPVALSSLNSLVASCSLRLE